MDIQKQETREASAPTDRDGDKLTESQNEREKRGIYGQI
jgi:hypothetical protein